MGGGSRGGFGDHQTPHHWQPQRQDYKDGHQQQAWAQPHGDWQHQQMRGAGITQPLATAALHGMVHGPPSPMNAFHGPPSPYGRPPQHNGTGQHQLQLQQAGSPIHAVHIPHAQALPQSGGSQSLPQSGGAAVAGTSQVQPVSGGGGGQPGVAFGFTNTPPLSPSGQYGQQYGFNYS